MLTKPSFAQIAGMGHLTHPRYRGCVGHWPFHDGGGLVAMDISGFRHDGTFTNMSGANWLDGPGQFGWVVDFDGADDYITANYVRSGPFSIVVWVNLAIRSVGDAILSSEGTTWFLQNGGGISPWQFSGAVDSIAAPVDAWTHLVGTQDASDVPRLYRNGVLVATGAAAAIGDTTTLEIGRRGDGLTIDAHVEEVRVYNRALDAVEIASLFTDPYLEFRARRRLVFNSAAGADATVSATESGRVAATDASALTATLAPAESVLVAETDLTGVSATLAPADAVAIAESDAAFPTPAVAAAESDAVVGVEATALSPALAPSDPGAVVESDASGITAALGPIDASALGAVEAVGVLTAALAASEADAAGLAEQAPIDAAISAAETIRVAALETASAVETVAVSATDSGRVGATETASVVESEPSEIAEAPAIPEVFTAGWVRVPPVPAPGYGLRRRGRLAVLGPVGLVLAVGRTHAPRRGVASIIGLQGPCDGQARLIRRVRTGRVASGAGAGVLRAVGVTVSSELIAQRTREDPEFLTLLTLLKVL